MAKLLDFETIRNYIVFSSCLIDSTTNLAVLLSVQAATGVQRN